MFQDFKCLTCSATFKSQQYLNRHVSRHFAEKRWKCPLCPSAFIDRRDLVTHDKHVHQNLRPWICEHCHSAYKTKQGLQIHQKSYPTGNCITMKRFSGRGANRIEIGEGGTPLPPKEPPEKPFECPECKKRFAKKSRMEWHLKLHSDNRPFPCTMEGCDKAFTQKQTLRTHLKQYHQIDLPSNMPRDIPKPIPTEKKRNEDELHLHPTDAAEQHAAAILDMRQRATAAAVKKTHQDLLSTDGFRRLPNHLGSLSQASSPSLTSPPPPPVAAPSSTLPLPSAMQRSFAHDLLPRQLGNVLAAAQSRNVTQNATNASPSPHMMQPPQSRMHNEHAMASLPQFMFHHQQQLFQQQQQQELQQKQQQRQQQLQQQQQHQMQQQQQHHNALQQHHHQMSNAFPGMTAHREEQQHHQVPTPLDFYQYAAANFANINNMYRN